MKETVIGDASTSAPAAACAADLLQALARGREALTLSQLARELGCTRSLVFRVAHELTARDLIIRSEDGRYSLGVATLELGGAYLGGSELAQAARQITQDLSRETGETTNLGVLRQADVIYLIRSEGRNALLTVSHIGGRIPANCAAMGKALLAELDERELERTLIDPLARLTPNSLGTLGDLKRALVTVRDQGYATDEQEAVLGRSCLAAALASGDERAALSISVSALVFAERRKELLVALLAARDRLDREINGRLAMQSDDGLAGLPAGAGYG
jgi:DNA-binding IclR family transcriptional regulator